MRCVCLAHLREKLRSFCCLRFLCFKFFLRSSIEEPMKPMSSAETKVIRNYDLRVKFGSLLIMKVSQMSMKWVLVRLLESAIFDGDFLEAMWLIIFFLQVVWRVVPCCCSDHLDELLRHVMFEDDLDQPAPEVLTKVFAYPGMVVYWVHLYDLSDYCFEEFLFKIRC